MLTVLQVKNFTGSSAVFDVSTAVLNGSSDLLFLKVSVTSWRYVREFWAACRKEWNEIYMSFDSTFITRMLAFLPPGHPATRGGDSPFSGQAAHADGGKVWAHLRPLCQLAGHVVHESSPLQLPVWGELCPVLSSYQYEVSFALFSRTVTSLRWALPCSLQSPVWGELCCVLSSYQYEVSLAVFSPVTSMRCALPCSSQLQVGGWFCLVNNVDFFLFSPVISMRLVLPCSS